MSICLFVEDIGAYGHGKEGKNDQKYLVENIKIN